MIESDYKKIFRTLKDINHQTEILELLNWDEDLLNEFNSVLINLLSDSNDLEHLLEEVTQRYDCKISEFVKKLINSYAQDVSEDHIIQGVPYEA